LIHSAQPIMNLKCVWDHWSCAVLNLMATAMPYNYPSLVETIEAKSAAALIAQQAHDALEAKYVCEVAKTRQLQAELSRVVGDFGEEIEEGVRAQGAPESRPTVLACRTAVTEAWETWATALNLSNVTRLEGPRPCSLIHLSVEEHLEKINPDSDTHFKRQLISGAVAAHLKTQGYEKKKLWNALNTTGTGVYKLSAAHVKGAGS
jgi:hypothetical protein